MLQAYSPQEINTHYRNLPPILKEAMFSADVAELMFEVWKSFGLEPEKAGPLSEETGYVILGLTSPESFSERLAERLKAPKDKTRNIAVEINHKLFAPLSDELKKLHQTEFNDAAFLGKEPVKEAARLPAVSTEELIKELHLPKAPEPIVLRPKAEIPRPAASEARSAERPPATPKPPTIPPPPVVPKPTPPRPAEPSTLPAPKAAPPQLTVEMFKPPVAKPAPKEKEEDRSLEALKKILETEIREVPQTSKIVLPSAAQPKAPTPPKTQPPAASAALKSELRPWREASFAEQPADKTPQTKIAPPLTKPVAPSQPVFAKPETPRIKVGAAPTPPIPTKEHAEKLTTTPAEGETRSAERPVKPITFVRPESPMEKPATAMPPRPIPKPPKPPITPALERHLGKSGGDPYREAVLPEEKELPQKAEAESIIAKHPPQPPKYQFGKGGPKPLDLRPGAAAQGTVQATTQPPVPKKTTDPYHEPVE